MEIAAKAVKNSCAVILEMRIIMTELEEYYNKFCEDKRLTRRHGMVEYITSMKYIHKCLERLEQPDMNHSQVRILDVGARR